MDFSAPIVAAVVGVVILLFGRRLFWLFVAVLGFAVGMQVAPQLVHEPTPMLALSMALIFSFVGALLALFLQKVAVAVGGFLAGGQLAIALMNSVANLHAANHLIVYVIGGVIGAILLIALFNWALVILSALVGAHLIVSAVVLRTEIAAGVFIALAIIGIVVQAGSSRRRRAVAT